MISQYRHSNSISCSHLHRRTIRSRCSMLPLVPLLTSLPLEKIRTQGKTPGQQLPCNNEMEGSPRRLTQVCTHTSGEKISERVQRDFTKGSETNACILSYNLESKFAVHYLRQKCQRICQLLVKICTNRYFEPVSGEKLYIEFFLK